MKVKKYTICISPAANEKMYSHLKFLAQVSIPASERLLKILHSKIQSLSNNPLGNPEFNRAGIPDGQYRYMLINKRYRIIYQIQGSKVLVDDIQDCRQGEDKSLI